MTFGTKDTITQIAKERWATAHDPRLRQIMTTLVDHLHAFVREVELTHDEWVAATDYLTRVGQISDDKRKEFILLSDVLGVSMLVVMVNDRTPSGATPNTVLGPFHIDESPVLARDENMAEDVPGVPVYVSGSVRDQAGAPIPGVLLDIWQADEMGMYESQIPDSDARLRALQHTDGDGRYGFWTIAPKGYSIPMDGPVGQLMKQTKISHFRPAHIHFLISAPGYRPVITHLFREGAEYIDSDVVFGAKQELVVPFVNHEAGIAPDGKRLASSFLAIDYDFVLVAADAKSAADQPAGTT
jgi:hydroxyquinol 1,2-dioxygenase